MVRSAALVLAALWLSGCAQYNAAYTGLQKVSAAVAIPSGGAMKRGAAADGASGANGQPVYSASECIGTIVAGVCHGAISPQTAYRPRCYGQMLNGQCTGPIF